MKTVYWRATDPEHKFVSKFSWAAKMYYPMLKKFFDTFFRGDFIKYGKQVYLDHVDEIRRITPPERLLEFEVKDGWSPLCKFLGEDVPNEPFPCSNSVSVFIQRSKRRNRLQMMNTALQVFVFILWIVILGPLVHFTLRNYV